MTYPVVEMEGQKPAEARAMRLLAAATALVLALSVVGLVTIDNSSTPKSSIAAVLAAADKTAASTSARMTMGMSISVEGMGNSLPSVEMEGATEFAGERKWVMSMSAPGMKMEGVGRGTTGYFKVPDTARHAVATPWVSIEIPDSAASNPLNSLSGPSLTGGGDPTATLDYLRVNGLVSSAESTGRHDVRGTSTTGYRVEFDRVRFGEMLMEEAKEQVKAQPGMGGLGDSFEMTATRAVLDLFVDGDGLVRRQVLDMALKVAVMTEDVEMTMKMTIDLFDFGVAVDAPLPPQDQVTTIGSQAELTQMLMGRS